MQQEKISEVKIDTLVFDYNIYPRTKVESVNVSSMVDAFKAGISFPPIVVDQKSKRIVDGFHRTTMAKKLGKDTIQAVLRKYKSEEDLFLESLHLNSGHGRQFSNYDRARCINLATELGIDISKVAISLNLTVERASELSLAKSATAAESAVPVTLKRTISHMKGHTLTANQIDANRKLSGQSALFYVNQLLILFQNDLIDKQNEALREGLEKLKGYL